MKVHLDGLFGRECFLNELVWAYDFGGRRAGAGRPSTTRSSSTSRTPARYHFDAEEVDREPYMAPGLVAPEKAARGKRRPTVVAHDRATNGAERTGYPTQKPEGVVRRMVGRLVAAGRLVPGLLRRLGDARRGRARPRAALRARRREPDAIAVAARRLAMSAAAPCRARPRA